MGGSVLCVDNDRNLCQVMARALGAEGYDVATEYDGERALSLVADDAPDLVLLDLFLPGRDGFAVLEAIRELPGSAARTPVVLLCGCSPTPEYTRRATALDALALLTKPVTLEKLVSVVAGQLGEPKSAVPAAGGGSRAKPADGNLAGELERFPFAALLHHLHGLRASGVLHLQEKQRRKWVQLRDGYPTGVRSNLVNECLGNVLVRTGRIGADVMEESLRRMRVGGGLQGEILVAMEVLTEEDVSSALREQAEGKLFEAFSWKMGRFRFVFGERLQKASGLAKRSPANLILQGVRTRAPLEQVDGWLASRRDGVPARSEKPFYRFQDVDLTLNEQVLVDELDGCRPLSEFLDSDEPLRRALYALLQTGIIELRGGDAAPARAPRRDRPVTRKAPTPQPAEEEAQRAELAKLAGRFAEQNYFQILGVSEDASEDAIHASYERLAERAHPDHLNASSDAVQQLAIQVFDRVSRAYQTLSDPRRRQEYVLDCRRVDREAAQREEGRRSLQAEQSFQEGEQAVRARDYESALRLFGRALELNPGEGEYHAHYGWTLHLCHPDNAQMAEEGIEHVKRGVKLAPEREKPYLLMGRLCKAIGRAGAAEKMFTRAIQIQPGCVEALRELRLINMRRHKQKGFIGRLLRR